MRHIYIYIYIYIYYIKIYQLYYTRKKAEYVVIFRICCNIYLCRISCLNPHFDGTKLVQLTTHIRQDSHQIVKLNIGLLI